MRASILFLALLLLAFGGPAGGSLRVKPAKVSLLDSSQLALGAHHTRHAELFGAGVPAPNLAVLRGIDTVQGHAPAGGGFFADRRARPAESPVGYELRLFGAPLIAPPRATSYCSGATYAACIEALGLLFPDGAGRLSPDRLEALRMQEPDGGRREDYVKFWGRWNSQWGHELALVRYSGMGTEVSPARALSGDFVNLAWGKGLGHAAVFLGWAQGGDELEMLFWSSQSRTDGFGDRLEPLSSIKKARFVRLTDPEKLFTFDPRP